MVQAELEGVQRRAIHAWGPPLFCMDDCFFVENSVARSISARAVTTRPPVSPLPPIYANADASCHSHIS